MPTPRILIIDDDQTLTAMLAGYLAAENFETESAADGARGLQAATAQTFDLVILDVMLPRQDGFSVLSQLRVASRVPVLMLSARGQDLDRIRGLELGADDYLAKPFHPRELLARVQAILRRTTQPAPERIQAGDLEIVRASRTVLRRGEALAVTTIEFDLLHALASRAGETVSRESLYRTVLGRNYEVYDRTIDNHVSSLRRKLGPAADGSPRFKSVRNAGYVFNPA